MRRLPKAASSSGSAGFSKVLGIWSRSLGTWPNLASSYPEPARSTAPGKEVKGIYGFTVKVGLGDDGPRIEPFGNIRKDRESGHTVVQEVREPVVDVFEEEDHVLVVAEMPGVSVERCENYGGGRPADHLSRARREEVSQGGAASRQRQPARRCRSPAITG